MGLTLDKHCSGVAGIGHECLQEQMAVGMNVIDKQ